MLRFHKETQRDTTKEPQQMAKSRQARTWRLFDILKA
jgi:hypothetical protein